ncbi:MAG: restriction endonuclease subunit M [Alphaproteobacteria bacterium]|nr:restriction endonuclease subunit M [Alphaproteobacteria bacterium]
MAKTEAEIRELLETDLFKEGISKKYISINDELTRITYNCKNSPTRRLQNPEEFVQAKSYLRLIKDYNYLPQNIAVNEAVQVGSETKEADILVYSDDLKKILIVVECKEEEINERQFQVAVDQCYCYAHAKAAQYLWVTSGVKNEYFEITSISPVEKIEIADIPSRHGEVEKAKFVKGKNDPEKSTQGDLIQKFKSAHDALWGGGALTPSAAFDELDKLIFCKIWDERWRENAPKTKGQPYEFQIIYYNGDKESKKAKEELEKRVKYLYEYGRKKDPEVFKDDIRLDKNKIFTVVKYLQDVNLSETDLDAKGLAFQSFMSGFFRGDFGQYFTPNDIVKFIVDALNITNEDKVLDTSCGSGGFLLHALKKVRDEADETYEDKNSRYWYNHWHDFASKHLFGIEINEQISRVAKMNMIIHDDGHTNVVTNDALKNPNTIQKENHNLDFIDGSFDLIMTNPPFGSVVKASEAPYYKDYELFETNLGIAETKERIKSDDDKKKWKTSQSTEILFLERCYKYLKEGGYLAIVLPDGVLTNSSSQYVRDWLFEKFRIVAVVSLPQHTFSHVNAGVKSSVLFLRKHELSTTRSLEKMLARIKEAVNDDKSILKSEKANAIIERYKKEAFSILPDYEVLMLEVENIGYDATGRKKDGSELPIVSEKIRNFISKQGW